MKDHREFSMHQQGDPSHLMGSIGRHLMGSTGRLIPSHGFNRVTHPISWIHHQRDSSHLMGSTGRPIPSHGFNRNRDCAGMSGMPTLSLYGGDDDHSEFIWRG